MKKRFIILILLTMFFPLMTSKSETLMCQYEGWINKNHSSANARGHLYITMENDGYIISMQTLHNLDSDDFWQDVAQTFSYFQYLNPFDWDPDNFWNKLQDTLDDNDPHDYMYNFSKDLRTINRINAVPGIGVSGGKGVANDVVWGSESSRLALKNNGFCPQVVTFRNKSSISQVTDYDFEFVMDQEMTSEVDTGNTADPLGVYNYYLTNTDNYKYQYLSEELINLFNNAANNCVSDVDLIKYISDYLNFNAPHQAAGVGNVEKDWVSELLVNDGFLDLAQKYIDMYSPGTDCYENNPSAQSAYDALVKASGDFIYYSTGKEPQTVDTCEQIIGNGTFAFYLNQAFRFIQYVGPVLVIIYSTIEYIKVVAAADADLLKKTNKRTITRIIFALLLFLIPVIIKTILNIFGFYGNCLNTIL